MISKNLIEITYNKASIKKVLNALVNNQKIVIPEPNPYLVNAIVKSFYYHKQIQVDKTIEDLQTEEGLKDSKHIRNILNIKYLSPKLTKQILSGFQPKELSLQKLISKYY